MFPLLKIRTARNESTVLSRLYYDTSNCSTYPLLAGIEDPVIVAKTLRAYSPRRSCDEGSFRCSTRVELSIPRLGDGACYYAEGKGPTPSLKH